MTSDLTLPAGSRVAITGGAGFIGSTLARRLSEHADVQVVLFDNLHRDAVTASDLLQRPNVELIRGDVCDAEGLAAALTGASHVIHMASIAGVDTVMNNPVLTMKVCLQGTMNVLEVCQRMNAAGQHIERVVDFSPAEVFGRYAFRVT